MSKKKSKKPKKVSWDDIVYVVNNLPAKDLKIVDSSECTLEQIDEFMTTQIESGGDFKFQWDYEYGECPNISLVYYSDDYENSGYGVSARGEDFVDCMKILMYKFFEVSKGQLFAVSEAKQNRRRG